MSECEVLIMRQILFMSRKILNAKWEHNLRNNCRGHDGIII